MKELLNKLQKNNIHVSLEGSELKVKFNDGQLSNSLLQELKENKGAIIEYIRELHGVSENGYIVPIANRASYALSASQRRLWILSQFEESNLAYHIPSAYIFQGELNRDALIYAYQFLIDRHESLRTVFRPNIDNEVQQVVEDSYLIDQVFDFQDLRGYENVMEKGNILVRENFSRPFDLSTGPLIRAALYQIEDNKWIFSYVMHHIISDGWSIEVMLQELLEVYNATINGKEPSLDPLRIQYRDYTAWQLEQLESPSLEGHKKYWMNQFSGELPVVDLATDKPRPTVKTYNGGLLSIEIGKDSTSALKILSQESGGTLFMGLLSVVNALIYRYTGQTDIIIGSPMAGRDYVELQNQIGFYVNTLALRTCFSEGCSFRELFENVKEVVLGAHKHQLYPFDELVSELNLQQDLSRNPLFDIQVILKNADTKTTTNSTLQDVDVSDYLGFSSLTSIFELVFVFVEENDFLNLNITYNSDLYTKDSIIRLGTHLKHLLNALTTKSDLPLFQLDLLSHEETTKIFEVFNKAAYEIENNVSLVELFERQATINTDGVALVYNDKKISYFQLNCLASNLASFLTKNYQLGKDDLVGIMLDRSELSVISILGVLKTGAGYVPIEPDYPQDRKKFILQDSNVKLLITQTDYIFDLEYYDNAIFAIDVQLDSLESSDELLETNVDPNSLAYIIYTSGSTGQPKAVMIEHRAIANTILSQIIEFKIDREEKHLQFASLSFDASVSEIFVSLVSGGELYIVTDECKKSVPILTEFINKNNIDIATIPPSYLKVVDLEDLKELKKLISAGEVAVYENALSFGANGDFYNAYGPTETSICASVYNYNINDIYSKKIVPIGKPIANTEIYILDKHLNLLPIGAIGEICIAGAGLSRGYLNQPELTSAKFIEHPFKKGEKLYKSGDLGRWLPDGNIEYVGRKDGQVKIRGFRIELGELERVLCKHEQISSAVVSTTVSIDGEKELVAYLVPEDDSLKVTDIKRYLGEILPFYMVPSYYITLPSIPLTTNGKVDFKKLPNPLKPGAEESKEFVAPRNEIEKQLVGLWQDVLGRETIGIRDDFFEFGGHSLKATRLNVLINSSFAIKIELKELFKLTTVETQAILIEDILGKMQQDIEVKLISIWEEVLGISNITSTDNFFDLGGHSLKATRVSVKINNIFEVNVELEELFEAEILRDQAKLIRKASKKNFVEIPTAPNLGGYPLSSAQRRLWVLSQFEEGNVAYNVYGFYVFEDLNVAAMEFAVKALIERHESMRTIFKENETGEIRQYVLDAEDLELKMAFNDFRNISDQVDEEYVIDVAKQEFMKPFNLMTGPLVRWGVYRITDKQWMLTYQMHHIISDGWSLNIMVREIQQLYTAFLKGSANPLEPLRIQYKDYSVWQLDKLSNSTLDIHKEYWFKQFQGDIPVLELPSDRVRPAIKTYNGNILRSVFDPTITNQLKSISKEAGGTLFIGLMAAVNTLLFKYTNQCDIVIGVPIAGRDHLDLEGQLGFYVNTLAMRTIFREDDSFKDLLHKIRKIAFDSYEHQGYPFDELVEGLNKNWDKSRQALYDVMVVLQNTDIEVAEQIEENLVDIKPINYENTERLVSLFDLRFDFKEIEEGLNVFIEYNTDIYDKWRIERMLEHLHQIIRSAVKSPSIPLSSLKYVEGSEKVQLLDTFNDTLKDFPAQVTLIDLFQKQVLEKSDSVAVVFDDISVTYRELDEKSSKLANLLIESVGLSVEARVGVMQQKGIDLVVSILGILKAGGAYVPLDGDTPENRLLYMIDDSDISVLLTESIYIDMANKLQWRSTHLKHLICCDADDFYSVQGIAENALMQKDLWDSVGQTALDAISGGGWMSSYTGEYFTELEMEEYQQNIYLKLKDRLTSEMKVLEIGCSSGLTIFAIAPHVKSYHATDLSSSILENTQRECLKRGLTNVSYSCLPADLIDTIEDSDFDLIIINSVIHCFKGHNYFRDVLLKSTKKIGSAGTIFLGDIMDENKRDVLVSDMEDFKFNHNNEGYRTKTDWSKELFLSRDYLNDIMLDIDYILNIEYSDKIFTVPNELTRYRFDAILDVDKHIHLQATSSEKKKYQYDKRSINAYSSTFKNIDVKCNNLAYIIYTSGSTGQPKGCMLEHSGVINRIEWMWNEFGFTSDDIILQKTTFTFDVSVWELFMPLCWGAKMVMCQKKDIASPNRILSLIEREKVTTIHFVPSMLNAFISSLFDDYKIDISKLSTLRHVFTSGETLSLELVKSWYSRLDIPIHNLYGPTECSIDVTYFRTSKKDTSIPIGRPISNIQVYVLDKNMSPMPVGTVGEICVSGVGLSRGYINQTELTETKFVDHPFKEGERIYKTGDLGRWLSDGNIEYLGRMDDQVKIRGFRIELGEIEMALNEHDKIKSAIVTVKTNSEGEKELVAYMILQEGKLETSEIRSYLSKILPVYMLPAYFVQLDEFPITSSGKVDRKNLPSPANLLFHSDSTYVAPRNEIENRLAIIWQEVLGRDRIGVKDDFFELGGDSFKAIRIASKMRKEILIIDIYKNPTIASLSEYMASVNQRGFLQRLNARSTSKSSEVSLIIVPYAGGDPIGYTRLTSELDNLYENYDVYCIQLPTDNEFLESELNIDEFSSEIISEIRDKIKTPIILYSECIGAALSLDLARRLEEINADLLGICAGGALARTKVDLNNVEVSEAETLAFFKSIGATVPTDSEDQVIFSKRLKSDGKIAKTFFNNSIKNLKNREYNRLRTTIYCIIGANDPLTKDFRSKYKDWLFYSEDIELVVIPEVGHYISRDKPKDLALALKEITVGQAINVIEPENKSVFFKMKSLFNKWVK
ncbi:amino acid adenylation domain-containing protein [Sphingobacterium kitahiroshimense]|uniref:Amino acid adenylation domain-containing protein n=1 Tax=Sphingobacterium kitahiroshimense TaxID=470446 RepID=A0ABV0BNU4_9SPHI